jgi:hypothetical protein
MNAWCALTHERVIGPFFFDDDIIASNSFLDMLENYALSQLSSNHNKNLILQMDAAPIHFAHIGHGCFDVNFPGRWMGRGEVIVWAPLSSDLMHLDLFCVGGGEHVKDQVYSQRVNVVGELKTGITAAVANVTKGILKCI